MSAVFRLFLQADAFEWLGERYPDAATARMLLGTLGLPLGRLPAMTAAITPATYWYRVCETIDQGVSEAAGLADLAEAVAAEWPNSSAAAALAVAARAAEAAGGPRPR
jgi:hypothetical protein